MCNYTCGKYIPEKYQWGQAYGGPLDIRMMDTDHLENCLRICKKNRMWDKLETMREVLAQRYAPQPSTNQRSYYDEEIPF